MCVCVPKPSRAKICGGIIRGSTTYIYIYIYIYILVWTRAYTCTDSGGA